MWQFFLGGAILGGINAGIERHRQKQEIERQKGYAKEAYGHQTAYGDSMYSLQRGEALESLGIARNRLGEAFGADVEGFNLALEGQALQAHAARAAMADGAGMALAAQGASGTRGSDSLQRRIDFQEGMLSRQADLQERGNSLAMQGMARHYTNQFDDIGREADSWGSGGWRTRAKALGDEYAENIHGLQMKGYQDAISGMNDPMNIAFDYLSGIFGGAALGGSIGYQYAGYQQQRGAGAALPPGYMSANNGPGSFMPDYSSPTGFINPASFWGW